MARETYTVEEFAEICDLLFQAIYDERQEPNLDPDRGLFTGDVERAFARAILEDVLGLKSDVVCVDCGQDPEFYMVHDDVWAATGLDPDGGFLCLEDLERRLGRQITAADLTKDHVPRLPINAAFMLRHPDRFLTEAAALGLTADQASLRAAFELSLHQAAMSIIERTPGAKTLDDVGRISGRPPGDQLAEVSGVEREAVRIFTGL